MKTIANIQTVNINLSQIKPSSNNHRTTFSDSNFSELAESIKTQGLLQPIMVRATEDDMYEIVYGERRYRALLMAGIETIPAVVRENLTSSESMEIALTENLQREEISPIEEYKVYEQLMEHNGYDIELLMARFSKSESYIRGRMRLNTLIEEFGKLHSLQNCVVHQIRNSLKYVASKNRKEFMADLKPVYQAVNLETAECNFDKLQEKWRKKYPVVIESWERNWDNLTSYFAYDEHVRRLIYTTNAVEGFHRQLRKVTKTKGVFPNDMALQKLIYLAVINISKKWTQPLQN